MLKLLKTSFCLVLLLIGASASAAPTLTDYGTLPAVSMVSISPNGDLLAFRKIVDNKDLLVVTSLSERKQLVMLDITRIQPKSLFFLNNTQVYLLATEYKRVKGFRGKFDTSTGFVVDVRSKDIRQLLIPGEDKIYPGQTGLGRILGISEDGDHAFMPAFLGTTDLVLGKPVKPNYGLIKVKLKSKGRHKTIAGGTLYSSDFFVDPKGNLLAEERYDDKTNEHSIWVNANGSLTELFKENVSIRTKSFVGLTPDYSALVFIETNEETGREDYYLMDLKTAEISTTPFGREDADIEQVISDNNRVVRGVIYSGFTPTYNFFDPKLDARFKAILDQFPDHSVYLASASPDWKHIVVVVAGSQYADDYFLFANGSNDAQFMTSGRPNIAPEDINPIGKLTFAARDGLKIPTLITIPKDKVTAMKNLPAVVYPHGGPESHDKIGFDYYAQALAANGYLVIQPQFRGSDGFGRDHVMAGYGEWGKKMQDDLTDAVNFLASRGYIDPQKVCIVGASYGGYAALAGGVFTPDLYRCVVSINGVSNLSDMLVYDKRRAGQESWLVDYWRNQFGDDDKKQLNDISPEMHADKFQAPLLLIHSEDDKVVPYKQSASMYSAMKSKKKDVEIIKLKGDNHHLQEGETRLQALEATVKFVNQHLK